jgi:cbb3-type cytochrome oxidase subunit 3
MTPYEFVFLCLGLFFVMVVVFAWWMDKRGGSAK